ncbi:MAG: hypothetical protein GX430_00540 [Treponema sp.]|nr:hypothetical protein [Treponema sp.]
MKTHRGNAVIALALLLIPAVSAGASDFGLALTLAPKVSQEGFTLTVMANPWFSALLGENGELYLSGIVKLETTFQSATLLLDLGRSQVKLRPSPGTSWEFGRMPFADESGFVASGLMDGARWTGSPGPLGASAGLFYTGLLNKKSAEIVLTAADGADLLDADRFFAPPRLLAVLSGGLRNPPAFLSRLSAQAVGQFDLRGGSDTLHSQYLTLTAGIPAGAALAFELSAAAALAEPSGSDPAFHAAGALQVSWDLPTALKDQAYLGLRAATGADGGFPNVTALEQGRVFTPGPAGLATARLGYRARPSAVLGAEAQAVGFLRFPDGGPADAELDPGSDSPWLGAELYATVTWTPFSDLSVLWGAGVFLPASGGAFLPDTPARWLLSAAAVLSL